MTVCFRKRPQPAQVLRGFYLSRRPASAGEINGDGYSLIMADFDLGVHLDTRTERKQLPLPAKRGEGWGEGFVLVNIGSSPRPSPP